MLGGPLAHMIVAQLCLNCLYIFFISTELMNIKKR